ncbi:hypothetical protein MRB53_008128 [Persea americana]|uniref:Uncharacterized protein n=1 Tax=Persea americana TaxID=3435 RepID=A0ACC2ML64_PERAE|nr:hypothetical protein MRB53_008128 [Persea americana]
MDRSVDFLEISDMDWYFSRESDDLLVPTGLETSDVLCEDDRSLLPNGWLQWGVTASESFKSPNNTAIETTSKFNLGNSDSSGHGSDFLDGRRELQSFCHSMKGSSNIEQMDDIFLSSLLEEDSRDMENVFQNQPSIGKNSSCMGNSKYVRTTSFPVAMGDLSDDWDNREDLPPWHFTPSDYEREEGSQTETVVAYSEEESLEEAVLQELRGTMSQLNQKTRICFRDALYRLAKSSRERHPADHSSAELIVEEPSVSSVQDERSRCSNSTTELKLESNAIDRTIMNLLFQKLNCGPQDFQE